MVEKQDFQIIITSFAKKAYFEALEYIFEHHSNLRANKIALELLDFPKILSKFPTIGVIESNLSQRNVQYRFLLFKRTVKATVKIIYYADSENKTIFITDFFPCEMFEQSIKNRK